MALYSTLAGRWPKTTIQILEITIFLSSLFTIAVIYWHISNNFVNIYQHFHALLQSIVYPTDKVLKAECKTANKGLVIYRKPVLAKYSQQFANRIGAKTILQVYKLNLIAKQWITDAGKTEIDTWWAFVTRFSRIFAELAEGKCYLLTALPYKEPTGPSIWKNVELPALESNLKVTSIEYVDVSNHNPTLVIFERQFS